MGKQWCLFHNFIILCIFFMLKACLGDDNNQYIGRVSPGEIIGSQKNWIDLNGNFLVSKKGEFVFGFVTTAIDTTKFLLGVVHVASATVLWTANRAKPVSNSDDFVFTDKGNAFLEKDGIDVWSTNTSGKGVSSMELLDTGNLVLFGKYNRVIWQSFSYPTDTLMPAQDFIEGMKLISEPSTNNLTYVLEIKSGVVVLSAGYTTPQPYWTMQKENRKTVENDGVVVALAKFSDNSWRFYDKNQTLLWQFIFSENVGVNATWTAVLGRDGFITFSDLNKGGLNGDSSIRLPQDPCSTPEPCDPYNVCTNNRRWRCSCPSVLPSCKPGFVNQCDDKLEKPIEFVKADDGLNYFALDFLQPFSKTDLAGCQTSCRVNCSCVAMFFNTSSGNCFLLDTVGSFQKSDDMDSGYVSYIKVSSDGGIGTRDNGTSNKKTAVVVAIVMSMLVIGSVLLFVGIRYYRKKKLSESSRVKSEEDSFLGNLTGMPVRYSYKDLQAATNNFYVKLGQGGFGSVYKGVLPDGTQLAVKKLEGIGQGKKEFRAEVSIIGSIHHLHLVRLRGFCADESHRLLAYEYMPNGSLDRWIFKKKKGEFLLDWDTRFNIALGTAKGLAYLHEECDSKIIHCDVKPQNVLLDEHFIAKVSDFGLAKLMSREQSHVFTTLRGTRGYLAPEWIKNTAISEKSDVYSYGMLLLEIIGGRKNYDPNETSEKSNFPSFVYKMMEEGKVKEILDSELKVDENDDRVHCAIKVALWCIQEDMSMRPSMIKVVQILEGLSNIPKLPTSAGGTSSGPLVCGSSNANQSAVSLSGPR